MPETLTKPTLDELVKEASEHQRALEEQQEAQVVEEFLNSAVSARRRRVMEHAREVARQLSLN